MFNNERCVMAVKCWRRHRERMMQADNNRATATSGSTRELRHAGTQTDEMHRTDISTEADRHRTDSDDDVTVSTEQPETSPKPSIASSTTKSDAKRSKRRKSSPLRRQRTVPLKPVTSDDLIKAQVSVYETVRSATRAIHAARLEQIRSAYGVRDNVGEQSRVVGVTGPRSATSDATRREMETVWCLEQAYNKAVPVATGRKMFADKCDFRVRRGCSRNLNDFTQNMKGIATP